MTTEEDSIHELDELFQDTNSDKRTPNIITFKDPPPTEEKKVRRSTKKTKEPTLRKRPYKPRKNKVTHDPLDNFIVADVPILEQLQQQHEQKSVLSEPIVEPPPPPKKDTLSKKKQYLKHQIFFQLKEQGKSDNDIKNELKKLENLSEEDIDFELEKIKFTQTEHFTDKVAQLIKNGTGWVADNIFKTEGKIKEEFDQDGALKDALHKSLLGKVSMFGLNGQIVLLSAGDIISGYSKHKNNKNISQVENKK